MSVKFGFEVWTDEEGKIFVHLPHQCDEWHISRGDGYDYLEKEKAISELEAFIVEAQETLRKLKGINEN